MNVGRRICCNAANAFRPANALRNTFLDPIGVRFASRSSFDKLAEFDIEQPTPLNQSKVIHDVKDDIKEQESLAQALDTVGVQNNVQPVEQLAVKEVGVQSLGQQDGTYQQDINIAISRKSTETLRDRLQQEQEQRTSRGKNVLVSPKLKDIADKKLGSKTQEVLEYEGRYVRPVNKTRMDARTLPWLEGLNRSKEIARIERVGAEVAAFGNWSRPTESEAAARESLIQQTTKLVKKYIHGYGVEVFGSSRNGLGLASSDIDLRLYRDLDGSQGLDISKLPKRKNLAPRMSTRKQNFKMLEILERRFRSHPEYILCHIRHARYPLLHMQHTLSGMDVQIVCSNDTSVQRARIARYLQTQPHLFDLYAVLKTLLEVRGLADVFRGGLGSYNILIMIVAALEGAKLPSNPNQEGLNQVLTGNHDEKLGKGLLQVLGFYGQYLDTYKYAIVADPFSLVKKIDHSEVDTPDLGALESGHLRLIDKSQPYLLCLEDPDDSANDLGRQAYGWKHIQETMRWLFQDLNDNLNLGSKLELHSYLFEMVAAAAPSYNARRRIAQSYGAKILEEQKIVLEDSQSSDKGDMEKNKKLGPGELDQAEGSKQAATTT